MHRFYGAPLYDHGPDWVHWLFVFLIVVAIVAGILLIVRMWAARPHTTAAPWRGGPPPPPNPAITELDMRYARGDIAREEYLQRRADLLGHVTPPPGGPGSAPPPPPA